DPDDSARVTVAHKGQRDVVKGNGVAMKLYAPLREAPKRRLSWAATTNIYFTCTIAPLSQNGKDNPSYLADVSAIDLDGSPLTDDDRTVRFVTVARPLPPGRAITLPADVYLGEKDADAFRTVDDYVRRNYYDQIALGFGMCTFSWLVQLMIWLLNTLFIGTRDYGVAIIILVLIVRLLLHPITKKGQVNMVKMQHRMQEVAPKIEEIKKKYANDKVRMNQEMMKLNINPAGQMLSCLPMMIQMPIWVALYLSLSNNIGMRHQPAFWGLTWIHDLTAPDALYTFASPLVIPLLGWELPAFNLLPLLLAVFMYTQQKMQPKPKPSPNATDQQKQQQQMMQSMMPLMSIMMLIFFYKAPGGLNLYIMCSSLFGTIEQHYIRKHIKEREAAGTLHKPAPKDRDDGDSRRKPAAAPGFLERLQKMADQAGKRQHQAQRKPKPKPGR
ncbi:MAG: YidC/Oxa1 family membrane protein insertase, partial [Phycisphaerae bacterium]